MKKIGSFFGMMFAGAAMLAAVSTLFAADAVVDECSECADTVVVAGQQQRHTRRPMAAPVYFANAFPEYTLGSPNIYAGYPDDTVLVVPTRSKGPHHYGYWNRMYNGSPYYGKSWDKNWTVAGENAVYPGSDFWRASGMTKRAGYPAYSGGYQTAGVAGSYQAGYIADFDNFCTMPCTEPCPILNCLRSIFGCCCAKSCCPAPCCPAPCCFDCCDPCFCCEPCCDPCCAPVVCCDPCCDPCGTACNACADTCDPCAGIGFAGGSSCCGGDAADLNDAPIDGTPLDAPAPADVNAPTEVTAPANNVPAVNVPQSISTEPAPANQAAPGQYPVPAGNDDSLMQNPNTAPVPAVPGENKTGYIQMTVPEDAVVYVNGYQTKMTGTERRFAAAGLEEGMKYQFDIRVEVIRNGQTFTDTQTAYLYSGTTMNVAFQLEQKMEQLAMNR